MGLFCCFLCPGIPLGTRQSGEAIPDLGMLSGWVFVFVVVCFLEASIRRLREDLVPGIGAAVRFGLFCLMVLHGFNVS